MTDDKLKFRLSDYTLPSVAVLIGANLIPLYGVIFHGWEIFPVIFLYWFENVIVGAFNILKLLTVQPKDIAAWVGKLFMIPFFCFHYGLFTGAHGWFIFSLFGDIKIKGAEFPTPQLVFDTISRFDLLYVCLGLIASHGFSFVVNYIRNGEYQRATVNQLFFQPYGRIVILHLTILLGGFLADVLHSPTVALIFLIILKISVDAWSHLRERKKFATVKNPPSQQPQNHGLW
ncbi:MAG: hypothetical protein EPO24_13380 [Bacteroidetes bacterium]|nr:MAG: hypothetical protein EPO24_13380 [Bacteroidota bacterium]